MIYDAHQQDVVLLLSHLKPLLGLERCALRLVQELPLNVTVVCIGESDDGFAWVEGGSGNIIVSLGRPVRGWRRVLALRRLRAWSRKNESLVIVAGVWAAIPLLLVRGRAAYRVIIWEHSLSSEKIATSRGLRLLSLTVSLLYRKAERIVAVSEDLADDIRALSEHRRVEVIPNYLPKIVAGRGFARSQQQGKFTILTVGSLTPTKNHQLLLQALKHLPGDCQLVVAGGGPMRTSLEALAADLGVGAKVRWLGYVEEIAPMYAATDVLVQPSLGETFGMAMFEGASLDIPVVTVDYPHARTLIPEYMVGQLSGPDPAGLAAAILRLRENPPRESEFAAARRAREVAFADGDITSAWLRICAGV